jgi:Fe-S-cluster containining protein
MLSNSDSFPTVIKDLINRFPYDTNPDGSCSMLNEDGLCSVYENRPIMCNVKLMGQLLHQDTTEWYRINAENCNKLINDANLDPKYLVQISEGI